MARPKKNGSEILVGILEEYWREESGGDLSRLKCSNLEEYAKRKGYTALAYDFRRDKKVRERMDEIRTGLEAQDDGSFPAAYRTLDIDAMLNNCKDVSELKNSLRLLDRYWREVYRQCIEKDHQIRQMEDRGDKPDNSEVLRLKAAAESMESENRKLRRVNSKLNKTLRAYLYPAVAEGLLREQGLPVPDKGMVDMEKAAEMVEGRRPEPFRGKQGEVAKRPCRQEVLMEQMRRMAKNEG